MKGHQALVEAKAHELPSDLTALGTMIGQLYTNAGLPVDMALNRVPATRDQKLIILNGACAWLVEHKRASGATEKAIERQRKANRQALERFIATGEAGLY